MYICIHLCSTHVYVYVQFYVCIFLILQQKYQTGTQVSESGVWWNEAWERRPEAALPGSRRILLLTNSCINTMGLTPGWMRFADFRNYFWCLSPTKRFLSFCLLVYPSFASSTRPKRQTFRSLLSLFALFSHGVSPRIFPFFLILKFLFPLSMAFNKFPHPSVFSIFIKSFPSAPLFMILPTIFCFPFLHMFASLPSFLSHFLFLSFHNHYDFFSSFVFI